MNEDNDNFQQITGGQFGQMEAAVGTDAYQANVAHTKAATQALLEQSEHIKGDAIIRAQRADLLKAAVSFLMLLSLPLYAALVFHAWKVVL